MKRIDRLLSEARLLRIHRAARAQRMFIPAAELDWMGECGTAQIVLNDVSSIGAKAAADPGLRDDGGPVFEDGDPAIDFSVVAPFIARVQEAIEALFEEMRPQDAILAGLWPRILGHFPVPRPKGSKSGTGDLGEGLDGDATDPDLADLATGVVPRRTRPGSDYMAPRKAAARDVAMLAAESVLFDVVRRVILGNDVARAVSPHADGGSIVVDGGRVRRVRPPRTVVNAEVRVRAALGGLVVPSEVKPVSTRLSPLAEKARRDANAIARAKRGPA